MYHYSGNKHVQAITGLAAAPRRKYLWSVRGVNVLRRLGGHTSADGLAGSAAGGAGAGDAGEAVRVAAVVRGAADLAGGAAGGRRGADAADVHKVSLAGGGICKLRAVIACKSAESAW